MKNVNLLLVIVGAGLVHKVYKLKQNLCCSLNLLFNPNFGKRVQLNFLNNIFVFSTKLMEKVNLKSEIIFNLQR